MRRSMKKRKIMALLLICATVLTGIALTGCKGKYAADNAGEQQTEAVAEGAERETTEEAVTYKDTLTLAVQDD